MPELISPRSARSGSFIIVLLVGLLALAGGGALTYFLLNLDDPSQTRHDDPSNDTGVPSRKPPTSRPPTPPPLKPLARLPVHEQEAVDQAIRKGTEYLKSRFPRESSNAEEGILGPVSLQGLTLLECGVLTDDPALKGDLELVRKLGQGEYRTYHLALIILFLDRLGDSRDRRLIQTMALRLIAGQQSSGGWTYNCPPLMDEELPSLFHALHRTRPADPLDLFVSDRQHQSMRSFLPEREVRSASPARRPRQVLGGVSGEFGGPVDPSIRSLMPFEAVPSKKEVGLQDLPEVLRKPLPIKDMYPDNTDNSNTQFATLGIWAAGRHGVPTERTLALLVKRFRRSQNRDGSWGYHFGTNGNVAGTPAMTGAGLLGLAVGYGLFAEEGASGRTAADDPTVRGGLETLARHLGDPHEAKKSAEGSSSKREEQSRDGANLYFLWTVERAGVLYNLDLLGGKDWYRWGAQVLVDHQNADGSWELGNYYGSNPLIDTCFALLFLKRANLMGDLSRSLQAESGSSPR